MTVWRRGNLKGPQWKNEKTGGQWGGAVNAKIGTDAGRVHYSTSTTTGTTSTTTTTTTTTETTTTTTL